MTYATTSDVAAALGRPIADHDETTRVNRWIKGAELIIAKRLGPLDALDPEALRYVIGEAVARKAANPEGKQSERIDDYSYRLTDDAASVAVTLTEDEWALLDPDVSATQTLTAFTPWTGRGGGALCQHSWQ